MGANIQNPDYFMSGIAIFDLKINICEADLFPLFNSRLVGIGIITVLNKLDRLGCFLNYYFIALLGECSNLTETNF